MSEDPSNEGDFCHGSGTKNIFCFSCGQQFVTGKGLSQHLERAGANHDGLRRLCPDFIALTWKENKAHFDKLYQGQIQ